MFISNIKIRNLRVIKNLDIKPSSSINIITGKNGAGKTTLLESIYVLARNKSFRNTQQKNLISNNEKQLQIEVSIKYSNESKHHIGLVKTSRKTEFTINGYKQKKLTALAKSLPIGVITPNIHKLIEDGPIYRRRFLDWGVFHVEHNYASIVQEYNRVLVQRNTAIQGSPQSKKVWDQQLVKYTELITVQRMQYLNGLIESFMHYANQFVFIDKINLKYKMGWDEKYSFQQNLDRHLDNDVRRGFTSVGPHRANIVITYDDYLAVNILSRGQQKLLAILITMAQLDQIKNYCNETPILLLDDIFSELDEESSNNLFRIIVDKKLQSFITTIDPNIFGLKVDNYKMFHVEQGEIV